MKRRTILTAAAIIALLLVAVPWLDEGIYIGSRAEPMTWLEEGNRKVDGEVLICRYARLRGSKFRVDEVPYWPGPRRQIYLVNGEIVLPEAVGVETCPVPMFWTWYGKQSGR